AQVHGGLGARQQATLGRRLGTLLRLHLRDHLRPNGGDRGGHHLFCVCLHDSRASYTLRETRGRFPDGCFRRGFSSTASGSAPGASAPRLVLIFISATTTCAASASKAAANICSA